MSAAIQEVTDKQLNELIDSGAKVLVDFHAEWCGPCKGMAPVLEQFAGKHGGTVTIAKVNVDHQKEAAAAFGVRGIPTFAFIQKGKPPRVKVGVQPLQALEALAEV